MVGVGIFFLGAEFEPDLTSYLFYNLYTVVSPIPRDHMYGTWIISFCLRFNIGRSTNTEYY